MSGDPGSWHTVAETAAHFKVGRKKVYAQCKAGAWPHHRTGDHIRAAIRFSPRDWDAIDMLMRPAGQVAPVSLQPTDAQFGRGLKRLARAA